LKQKLRQVENEIQEQNFRRILNDSNLSLISFLLAMGIQNVPAAEQPPPFDPNLLIFAGELRNFFEFAEAAEPLAHESTKAQKHEKLVQEMIATAGRVARAYFVEPTEVIQTQLNNHLRTSLKENSAHEKYFVLLGNGFAIEAARLLKILRAKQAKYRTYGLLGGTAVGLVGSGVFLWIKRPSGAMAGAAGKALTSRNLLIAGGIFAGATAIGFGVGSIMAARLPVDLSINNAKDFLARYPHGEDFIKDLNKDAREMRLRLSLLESTGGGH